MSHRCLFCPTWIGDDRVVCTSCGKSRIDEVMTGKTGQSDMGVEVIDTEKELVGKEGK